MLLRNKTAIIYGAAGSIGAATARIFAREGASLFLAGRTMAGVQALAQEITAAGGKAVSHAVDATDDVAVERHVRAVVAEAGSVDVLFNAIGMDDVQGPLLIDLPFDDFAKPILKAAKSQFTTGCAVARQMAGQGSGVLMTITAGPPEATPNIGGFGPACQLIEGLWRGLAAEMAPHGVRVVCLRSAGSPDSTDFQEMVRQHTEASGQTREDFLAGLGSSTLLGRLPSVTEVAEMAALMASDRASALTNVFLSVACGFAAD
ncbi:SDR family NAD(P)-dependent oxidoreductase [Arthrobacter sp. ISL-5]|uniref:SDR family NAD(P)-dependent oxidoreductase n=1 Tax=Arthrobacter sp. ISL-5 TaxID=2819111 RepID=UPI001BECD1C9|nr:SDR family oxidoreductase [Arthrobacter sp. ISL-5]MBT2556105.1 SDR family oxidoreductase [Arthrobacter sp. ISL-5]